MKKYMKMVALVLSLLLALSCTGCAAAVAAVEDPQLRTYTEDMLDAILGAEEARAHALVEDVVTASEFSSVFVQMQTMLSQVSDYDLTLLSIYHNTRVTGGGTVKTITAAYRMTTASGAYVVDVQTSSEYQNLASFVITPYENTDHFSTGTLGNMKGANVVQWLALLSNVLSVGVVVLAVVDCCRRKPKAKAAWIAVCLLGFLSVGVTLGASMLRFNFNVSWLFGYSVYICYGGGTKVIRLLLPVGAVVYFLAGRRSVAKEPVPAVEQVEVTEDALTAEACEGQVEAQGMQTEESQGYVPVRDV